MSEMKKIMKTIIKTMIQSFVISFVIHFICIIGTLAVVRIKTRNYKPDFASEWENFETLQNEVAIGVAGSPLFFLFTFIGTAFITGFIIILYRMFVGTSSS